MVGMSRPLVRVSAAVVGQTQLAGAVRPLPARTAQPATGAASAVQAVGEADGGHDAGDGSRTIALSRSKSGQGPHDGGTPPAISHVWDVRRATFEVGWTSAPSVVRTRGMAHPGISVGRDHTAGGGAVKCVGKVRELLVGGRPRAAYRDTIDGSGSRPVRPAVSIRRARDAGPIVMRMGHG